MLIHCIGNSHINNFSFSRKLNYAESFNKLFKLYHLGGVIAYNFVEHHLNKVVSDILPKINKEEDYILFCVGEVDCRLHLPLQADKQDRSDEDITLECLGRFNRVYGILDGYKFIFASTHPTTRLPHNMSNEESPVYSSCDRRNNICNIWNKEVQDFAEKTGSPYINFYKYLVDKNNLTKEEYYLDYCHLNSRKIRPFLKLEFESIGIKI